MGPSHCRCLVSFKDGTALDYISSWFLIIDYLWQWFEPIELQPEKQSPTARGGFTAASSWEHGESAAGRTRYVSFSLLLWVLESLIGFHGSIDVLTACMKSWLWMAVTVLSSLSEATALFSIGNLGDHEGKEVPPGAGCPACRGVLLYYCTIPCRKRGHESHNRSQATVFIISSALSCSQEEAATEKSFNWSHPGPYMPWTIRAI